MATKLTGVHVDQAAPALVARLDGPLVEELVADPRRDAELGGVLEEILQLLSGRAQPGDGAPATPEGQNNG